MLYVAQHPYGNSQPFSPGLGQFQSESLVLEYEYLFVQVNRVILDYVILKDLHWS